MADNTNAIHPRMAEAIANAEKAAVSNRGMYPHTKAGNVYQNDGEPLEETNVESEDGDGDDEEPAEEEEKKCKCDSCTECSDGEKCTHPECTNCEDCPDHESCSAETCQACKAD